MNCFEKNLTVLEKLQPELADLMRGDLDTSHIEILTSETGMPTGKVRTSEGKQVLLHDLKDPVKQAQDHLRKFDLSGNNGSVLLGFGLGYLAREMVAEMDKGHLLLICEADPALLKVALEKLDLEEILKSKQVKILVGKNSDLVTNINHMSIKFLTSKISVVKFNPSFLLDPETYAVWEQTTHETALTLKIGANTMLLAGSEMAGNILANTPNIIRSPGVKRLFNRFKNLPAIIVGAGPSLDKNVTLLKEVKDRAVIIAVDRVLGLLLPLGITPHLVPSIDYSKINYDEKYAPHQLEEKLFMVSTQTVYHKITKSFWGPSFSVNQGGNLSCTLSYYWGDKGSITSGLHVGHTAFCLARALGCDPIIFTGMDLAFTGDKLHAEDVQSSINRTPVEHLTCEDIFGDRIRTDPAFLSFVTELEQEIIKTDSLCIDATEGGARKKGTVIMQLRDAIERYCINDHSEIRTILEEEGVQRDPVKFNELIQDLQDGLDTAKEMKTLCQKTLKLMKKLKRMKKEGHEGSQEYSTLSRKAEQITLQIGGKGRIISMLENYNFANILFMGKDDTVRIDEIENPFKRLDKQLDRAEIYYNGLIKSLKPFAQDVTKLLDRLTLEQNAQSQLEQSEKTWNDYLTYAQSLIACQNYPDAEAALQKVLDFNPECGDAHYYLGQIYFEQNRFKSAVISLNQAQELKAATSSKISSLLKKCQERSLHWQQRCEKIRKQFLSQKPFGKDSEKETLLEPGNFYFRVKDYTNAENHYKQVINQHPHLPEAYYHLGHTYFSMGKLDEGVEALSRALELSPENSIIYRDLGLVSIDRGLVEAAERFFLKALELKPDDLELKEMLGNIYFNSGLYDKAIRMYEAILTVNPGNNEVAKTVSLAYKKLINTNLHASP
jgi:tetratricopeptide (TPR) repeat protein